MKYLIKTKLNKCPICGQELRHSEDWLDFIRCEEYDHCTNCNYYSGYAYGHYELSFGKYNFVWSYLTSSNDMINLDRKIQHKMFQVRRNWRKGRKYKSYK